MAEVRYCFSCWLIGDGDLAVVAATTEVGCQSLLKTTRQGVVVLITDCG